MRTLLSVLHTTLQIWKRSWIFHLTMAGLLLLPFLFWQPEPLPAPDALDPTNPTTPPTALLFFFPLITWLWFWGTTLLTRVQGRLRNARPYFWESLFSSLFFLTVLILAWGNPYTLTLLLSMGDGTSLVIFLVALMVTLSYLFLLHHLSEGPLPPETAATASKRLYNRAQAQTRHLRWVWKRSLLALWCFILILFPLSMVWSGAFLLASVILPAVLLEGFTLLASWLMLSLLPILLLSQAVVVQRPTPTQSPPSSS